MSMDNMWWWSLECFTCHITTIFQGIKHVREIELGMDIPKFCYDLSSKKEEIIQGRKYKR